VSPSGVEPPLTRNIVHGCIYSGFITALGAVVLVSEKADAWPPVVLVDRLWVDDDLVREGVGVGGCDGWDVVFFSVHNGDDLMRCLFQRLGHGTADLEYI